MSSQLAMSIMGFGEFLLSVLMGSIFWKRGLQRRFPAMGTYLALRVVSTPILSLLFIAYSQPWGGKFYMPYFFLFWGEYMACAVLVYFICLEVFRSALASLPGLLRFGLVIFRWAALVSVIVTFATLPVSNRGLYLLPDIGVALMRSVSLLELCLLAFLCLSMNALRLSVRDLAFGLALGFGIMSSNDFIFASLTARFATLTTPLQFAYESVILISLSTWVVYCALPEPMRKPVVMPVNSTIYRWNEIASALGHTGTQVAVQQPANSFFLTDVENVVEKVLNRNLKGRESES
ncbi:MAG: hypothetical protein ABSF17_05370 [Terracidiphilus sp.]